MNQALGKCPKISYTKVSDKIAYANSTDPDQTAPEAQLKQMTDNILKYFFHYFLEKERLIFLVIFFVEPVLAWVTYACKFPSDLCWFIHVHPRSLGFTLASTLATTLNEVYRLYSFTVSFTLLIIELSKDNSCHSSVVWFHILICRCDINL